MKTLYINTNRHILKIEIDYRMSGFSSKYECSARICCICGTFSFRFFVAKDDIDYIIDPLDAENDAERKKVMAMHARIISEFKDAFSDFNNEVF